MLTELGAGPLVLEIENTFGPPNSTETPSPAAPTAAPIASTMRIGTTTATNQSFFLPDVIGGLLANSHQSYTSQSVKKIRFLQEF